MSPSHRLSNRTTSRGRSDSITTSTNRRCCTRTFLGATRRAAFPSLSAATFVQLQPVTQESVTSYEAGIKATWWDRRVRFDAAAFYYDYKDKQIEGKEADPIFVILNILVNVPKSRVFGTEAQLTVEPVDGLTVTGSTTYLDSRIQDYTGINVLGDKENFAGEALPFTPLWSGRLDAEYRFPCTLFERRALCGHDRGRTNLVDRSSGRQSYSDTRDCRIIVSIQETPIRTI